ncbi:MAG: c-type cytochrome domain-containing protein, partial [Planctomycetaceae bacterium]
MTLSLRARGALALGIFLALIAGADRLAAQDAEAVDFGRTIQPVLARRCFPCHGPDKQEAGLRLDRRKIAVSELESGMRPIVPGQPDESELLARISAEIDFLRMPPEGKPLSEEEIAAFRRWIAAGAEWE